MSDAPVRFLTAVGKALSDMILYRPGHPARIESLEAAHERLADLQREEIRPAFTLLDGSVLYGSRPLPGLRNWEWADRLGEAGVSRLEFQPGADRTDLETFLEDVLGRLTGRQPGPGRGAAAEGGIRYGAVGLRGAALPDGPEPEPATLGLTLGDEAAAVRWINSEVEGGRVVPLAEAAAVVASLAVSMHAERGLLLPLLRIRRYDEYTTTHALNVAVLSMALAEWIGVADSSVRQLGLAGLLHDIGKVNVPVEVLNKPGRLTEDERRVMNTHPVHGARILFETAPDLELPSVVAYEHHIMDNGAGYPDLRYHRDRHEASKLVHVCDVYDALRTDRPYRDAWSAERVLTYIMERAGTEFDVDAARRFVEMMGAWDVVAVEEEAAISDDGASPSGPGGEAPPAPRSGSA